MQDGNKCVPAQKESCNQTKMFPGFEAHTPPVDTSEVDEVAEESQTRHSKEISPRVYFQEYMLIRNSELL